MAVYNYGSEELNEYSPVLPLMFPNEQRVRGGSETRSDSEERLMLRFGDNSVRGSGSCGRGGGGGTHVAAKRAVFIVSVLALRSERQARR